MRLHTLTIPALAISFALVQPAISTVIQTCSGPLPASVVANDDAYSSALSPGFAEDHFRVLTPTMYVNQSGELEFAGLLSSQYSGQAMQSPANFGSAHPGTADDAPAKSEMIYYNDGSLSGSPKTSTSPSL